MPRRIRNLAIVGVVVALASFLVVSRIDPATPSPRVAVDPATPGSSTLAPPETTPTMEPSPDTNLASYALPLSELRGVPPDIPSGSTLELWVTWEPPITKEAQVQLLLREVTLQKIIPTTDPEGPPTALLGVRDAQIGDLIYGDRYGSFHAVIKSHDN